MNGDRVGVQIGASTPPRELAAVAAEAERLGYSEIWLAEDYFELGGIASAAVALSATERIRVGLGVVAAAARHPAVTAMEFATLADAFPGRFMAGMGHGAPEWVRQMGLEAASPLSSLREAVTATRKLLTGAALTHEGEHFTFDGVRLLHAPDDRVPLYLGVHGPASLRLSGELADGTLLGWFSSPGYVAWARERIDEGRARSGRRDPHDLVVLCVLSTSDVDPVGATQTVREWAAPLLARMASSPLLTASHEGADLRELLENNGGRGEHKALPDEMLRHFLAAGDVSSCAATVERLFEAGADRVALVPNPAGYRTTAAMIEQIRAGSALIAALCPAEPWQRSNTRKTHMT